MINKTPQTVKAFVADGIVSSAIYRLDRSELIEIATLLVRSFESAFSRSDYAALHTLSLRLAAINCRLAEIAAMPVDPVFASDIEVIRHDGAFYSIRTYAA